MLALGRPYMAWGRRLDRRPGRRLMPDPVGRRPASRASLGLHVPGWSQKDLKAKPALPAAHRGRSSSLDRSSLAVHASSMPGEPKVLQPTIYLEYGKRLLRGRLQQPPPKAPKSKDAAIIDACGQISLNRFMAEGGHAPYTPTTNRDGRLTNQLQRTELN